MSIPIYEHIRATPVLRPIIIYLLGWLVGYFYPDGILFVSKDLLVLAFLVSILSFMMNGFITLWFQKVVLFFFILFFGMYQAKPVLPPDFNIDREVVYLTEVAEYPVRKPKSFLIKLSLNYNFSDSIEITQPVYINAYFEIAQDSTLLPIPGDQVIIISRLQHVKNNGNPEEFDYASWLKRKQIFFSSFVKSGDWIKTGRTQDSFHYRCLKIREELKHKILNFRLGEYSEEKAVLIAISLGSKEFLDPDTKSDFADAGAIHVMAVSGLHVGLIWLFIDFITGFLKSSSSGRKLQFILIIGILWTYAGVTGMSASVTRSCLMFSLVSFGSIILRQSSVFNTVLVSAFIQLLINPQVLLDTGFQFSYTAVFSILFFQPLLRKVLFSESKILDYIANLVSVSVAAQILTFPLAIFYFHQFPIWFILTNIVVIPLVTVLMMIFISSLFFLLFPVVYNFFMITLIFLTGLMIRAVESITSLPLAIVEGLTINSVQLFLLLLSSLIILIFIHYGKLRSLKYFIAVLILFFLAGSWKYSNRSISELWILNVPNALAIDINYGGEHYLIHNLESDDIQNKLSYYTKNYSVKNYLKEAEFIAISSLTEGMESLAYQALPGENNGILSLGSKNIILVGDSRGISNYKGNLSLENEAIILFDSGFYPQDFEESILKSNNLLITPACRAYSNWFKSLDGSVHFLRERGAYGIKFK